MSNPSWPAVVHVDLDGANHVYRSQGWDYPHGDDPVFETGFANMLEFLERNDIRATLFAVASDLDVPEKRAALQRAVAAGHEIASHSITHPDLDKLDREAKHQEIAGSRLRLEKELGVAVEGFRAPSYSIDRDGFELLGECGYRYDSSTFARRSFARRLKVPAILPMPHKPLLDRPVVELPVPFGRLTGLPLTASYSLVLGQAYFDISFRHYQRSGLPFILLFHLIDFAEPLGADRLVGAKSRLLTLSHRSSRSKLAQCQRILDRVRGSYDVADTATLLTAWESNSAARRLVLGISATHDTGAVIYEGHDCLAAINEERLDRVKLSVKYPPKKSIKAAIETAGVDPRSITDVVIAGLPPGQLFKTLLQGQVRDTFEFHGWNDYFPHFNKVLYRTFAFGRSLGYRRVYDFLQQHYGIRPRLHFLAHHLCHAAAAYRTAPFDNALVVTADGVGDGVSLTVSAGRGGRLRLLNLIRYPHSFGQFYTACTQTLGFDAERHEGKITGLSGYGTIDPVLYRKVKSTLRTSGPDFKLDKRYYSEGIVRGLSLGNIRKGEGLFEAFQYRNYKAPLKKLLEGHPREDVAAVFQKLLEEELIAVVKPFAEKTGLQNLCLSGGIFANVKANAALFRALKFDNVYIYPHMGDGGLGAGAALELLQAEPVPFDNVYLGPSYEDAEMAAALESARSRDLQYRREDDVEDAVAQLLTQGKVVARFNGRMEFGPRALGNRSILYGAGDSSANGWLNSCLGRSEFMPFAPIVMAQHASRMFKGMKGTEHACKFMTIVLECTDWTKRNSPAVVHVDGTARPQFLSPGTNPSMYRILERYYERTGIPLLINTSFNLHEDPIVCTPQDAVRAFLASRLDYLAMGPFLAWSGDGQAPAIAAGDIACVSGVASI